MDPCPESAYIWWMAHADDRQMDIVRERFETLSNETASPDSHIGHSAAGHISAECWATEAAKAEEATYVSGDGTVHSPDCNGWLTESIIFTGAAQEMDLAGEEIFGTVLAVLSAHNDDRSVETADDGDFGLAARIWYRDAARAPERAGRFALEWNRRQRSLVGGCEASGHGRDNRFGKPLTFTQ